MSIGKKLAYAMLATSLVACFEEEETERPEFDPAPHADAGQNNADDHGHGLDGGVGAPGAILPTASRGAAVVLSPDEKTAVVVNRDVGSLTVVAVNYEEGKTTYAEKGYEVDLGKGSEPWQVVISPDSQTAFVVLRRDQKLVRIKNLSTRPEVDGYAYVGSEPTSLALSPSGRTAYVANWGNGDLSVVDTGALQVTSSVDLNAALVKTGYLGKVSARPALAHPRSITVTNDLDGDDRDETLLVTEYFSQQVQEVLATGLNADVARNGIVYKVAASDYAVSTINLGALEDIGFKDVNGNPAGCFPNQLQSVTVNGNFAYVTSVCAAPEGPEGLKVTTTACTTVSDCMAPELKLVDPVCDVVAFGKTPVCQDVAGFKTATSPVISVIDIKQGHEVVGAAQNLNKAFDDFFKKTKVAPAAQRFPLFATDLDFVPGTSVGYVVASGIDAVFRVVYDAATGKLTEVGSGTSPFINLNPAGIKPELAGKGPLAIAIGASNKKFALVPSLTTRNLQVLDFNTQALAGGVTSPSVFQTAALPPKDSDEEHILLGKDLFNTGRARWSLAGQGWGACQSCHSDGLSDGVTWFFGRGPRQSTSLDGSFASKNALDQRILNHTSNRDEFADFELNTRNTSGGVGAIVLTKSAPPVNLDRIDTPALKLAELDGSSLLASDPTNPLGLGFDATGKVVVGQTKLDPSAKSAGGLLEDWKNITRYAQTIRTPRSPTNLDPEKVAAGAQLFASYGSCQGCHGGDKWTVSRLFYTPGVEVNAALKVSDFVVPAGFPTGLLPAEAAQDQKLVINAGGESVQCVQRNVQTFNKAEDGVGIAEVRGTDMKTPAQGGGVALRPNADNDNDPTNDPKAGIGYNVPSLIGVATGAPYLHAGNARTLESLFDAKFDAHTRALAPNFLKETDPAYVEQQKSQLIQYLLSIDEDKAPVALPTVAGASGGALCPDSFVAPEK
ncbi:MAG: collagen triple helix repeat domain protein [Myxococcaceae bacterium]|nr:collagen triple helix repeat domain protein [Myxococcaceae bacterium]